MVWVGLGWPHQVPTQLLFHFSLPNRLNLEGRGGTTQGKGGEIIHQLPLWTKTLTWGKLILLQIENTDKWAPSGLQLSSGHLQLLWHGVFHGLQGWYLLQQGAFQGLQALLLEAPPPLITVHGVCKVVSCFVALTLCCATLWHFLSVFFQRYNLPGWGSQSPALVMWYHMFLAHSLLTKATLLGPHCWYLGM